jgi:hypothetical protein
MPESLRSRVGLALTLLPILGQFLAVFRFGVNTPVADELLYLEFVRALRTGFRWVPMLWSQHNEHRVVPVKLVMLILQPFVGWNLKAEMYVSAALAGLTVLGLWRLYLRMGGRELLLFAPVAWLFCNLAQYENMLFGLQMCHYFTVAGLVWALVCLARGDRLGVGLAAACALVATLSILNGLLVWPLGLFVLAARREPPAWRIAWAATGAAAFGLYFLGFAAPGFAALHPTLRDLPRVALYTLRLVGAPLAAGSVTRAAGIALALLAAMSLLAIAEWRRRGGERLRGAALPAALALFGALSCALIAAGRVLTDVPPLQSRYIAYSVIAFIGAYLAAARAAERGGRAPALGLAAALALLIPGVAAADLRGLADARLWRNARLRDQFLLQTFDRQPDAAFGGPDALSSVRRLAPYLRAERLAAFGEPQQLLLIARWDQPRAAGPILPGRPVELRLRCPVADLHDAGVALSREGTAFDSTVTVSLWLDGRRIAAREVLVAQLAAGWVGLVQVPLPVPLRGCAGRPLTVRIDTPGASPAARVTAWTYPAYYDGDLRQAGAPLAPGRSLGLALNGYHFGFLR